MTEHRPGLRVEVSIAWNPRREPNVLIQADEWHLLLAPKDALKFARSVADVAAEILDIVEEQ
jgi:hypothetical protein